MVTTPSHLRVDQLISVIALSIVLLLYRGLEQAGSATKIIPSQNEARFIYSVPVSQIPVYQPMATPSAATATPTVNNVNQITSPIDLSTITASATAVIDLHSDTIMYEKNARKQYLPASTTKLMTALVAREHYELDDVITISEPPEVDGAAVEFYENEQLTVESLLQALLIQSGNDAGIVLAEHHPAGRAGFITAMNEKAAELNLKNTHFANVTGFDAPDHYSSALDLAILSKVIMQDEVIRAIVRQPRSLITDLTGSRQHFLYSTNILLSADPTVVGIKTGTTAGAGEVLITQVERDDKSILIVVMGSEDRYLDTLKLIEWSLSEHQWRAFDEFN